MEPRKKVDMTVGANRKIEKKRTLSDPDFDSMLSPVGLDGIPVINDPDPETVAATELDVMMATIRDQRRSYTENFRDVEAGEFWFCVCFQSRSQKEEFLVKLLEKFKPEWGVDRLGDKYLSGLEIAEMMDIAITPIKLEVKKSRLAPKKMRGLEVIE